MAPIGAGEPPSRHCRQSGASGRAPSTLLTSIVSPIDLRLRHGRGDLCRNSRLWFEGKRPSSRETPIRSGDAGRRNQALAKATWISSTTGWMSPPAAARRAVIEQGFSILPGQFGRVRLIGSSPMRLLVPIPRSRPISRQDRLRGQGRRYRGSCHTLDRRPGIAGDREG